MKRYMKLLKLIFFPVLACILLSCGNDGPGNDDTMPPGVIENLIVKRVSNGTITFGYNLPSDEDVYYVKVRYEVNSKVIEHKASFLNDSIFIEGLPDTQERTYEFFVGDRYENESQGVKITATCDTPPHILALGSAITKPDYGGGKIVWENETGLWVYLNVSYLDDNGAELMQIFKSKSGQDSVIFGDMWSGEKAFSYYYSDRFGNKTEKIDASVNALPAELLPKDNMKLIYLKGDIPEWYNASLFNNDITDRFLSINNGITDFSVPYYVTVDLGRIAQVSKMMLQGSATQTYAHYAADLLKEFEVYGTAQDLVTAQDPNSVSWELMIPKTTWEPQFPNLTKADNISKGFTVGTISTTKVRYLRVKLISRYTSSGNYGRYHLGTEWTFYGSL